MKKNLARLLSLALLVSLFTGCTDGPDGETGSPGPSQTVSPSPVQSESPGPSQSELPTEPPGPVEPEELPEALYHWDFESAEGLLAVAQTGKAAGSPNTGGVFDLVSTDQPILAANGVVGKCLYLNGKYGVKLATLQALSGGAYTVSFWVNAARLSTFGPVVQLGRSIGKADTGPETVAWLNFTTVDPSWMDGESVFPVVWNCNTEKGVWSWTSAPTGTGEKTEYGREEWTLATLVVDGVEYTADDGLPRVGARLYINGELKADANAGNRLGQGIAPEILQGAAVEGYIGVNYLDAAFEGFIDELYIFDQALTAGQVLTLFQQGDPSSVPDPAGAVNMPVPGGAGDPGNPGVVDPGSGGDPGGDDPAESAVIATIGSPDLTTEFWGACSDSFELADGASAVVRFRSRSNGAANRNNFTVAFVNTETSAEPIPGTANYPGYAEYAILRADAYGWGDASYKASYSKSWTDWSAWLQMMRDAEVTLSLTRSGGLITADISFAGANGMTASEVAIITTSMTADSPCWFFLTVEHCCLELLSVS